MVGILKDLLKMQINLNEVSKMILNKIAAKNSAAGANQMNSRALNLMMEEMAVWYPAPYYDVEAMVAEDAEVFKSNRRPKVGSSSLPAKRSKSKKSLGSFNGTFAYA
jgi:hypothetical protein